MKLRIISVGHKMPGWVETACAEYIKRMPRELSVEIIEIKPDKRADGKNSTVVQEAEAKRILEAAGRDFLVVCDERGQEATTLQLAEKMQFWQSLGKDISIVVGGADGIHASLKQQPTGCGAYPNLPYRMLLYVYCYVNNSTVPTLSYKTTLIIANK